MLNGTQDSLRFETLARTIARIPYRTGSERLGQQIAVGATKDAYKRYIDLVGGSDAVGVLDLKISGQVYMVPSGTPVVRIGGMVTSEVRIMDGEHAGKLGWVDVTMVKSARRTPLRSPAPHSGVYV